MSLFTKISKITAHFRKYSFEIFLGSFKTALLKYFKSSSGLMQRNQQRLVLFYRRQTVHYLVLCQVHRQNLLMWLLKGYVDGFTCHCRIKVINLKTISVHARIHMQTPSHQRMTLENISNTGKLVIIRKYFFEIFGLPLFSKIQRFENYYVYGTIQWVFPVQTLLLRLGSFIVIESYCYLLCN